MTQPSCPDVWTGTWPQAAAADVVARALAEDAPHGDLTSAAFVPADASASGAVRAREVCVVAGAPIVAEVMAQVDPRVVVAEVVSDGRAVAGQAVLAHVSGPARSILRGERVALNLLSRLVAVATRTRRYVDEVAGARSARGQAVRVVDTRKTTPGLRALEKYAVTCGGGFNHRFSLSDAVMVKDNHLAALLGAGGDVTQALRDAAARLPHTTHIEVEVDRLEQIEPVLASGVVGTIMLDNFDLDALRLGVERVAGRALVEASGGVTLATVGQIARTGVDLVSVGALTHGAGTVDLGLDLDLGGS